MMNKKLDFFPPHSPVSFKILNLEKIATVQLQLWRKDITSGLQSCVGKYLPCLKHIKKYGTTAVIEIYS